MLKTHRFMAQAPQVGDNGGRVEFLPVHWHSALHGDDTGVNWLAFMFLPCNEATMLQTYIHTLIKTVIVSLNLAIVNKGSLPIVLS